jgi:hypothetical protein
MEYDGDHQFNADLKFAGLHVGTTEIDDTDSPYSLLVTDYQLLVDTTGGAVTVVLPTAQTVAGREVRIKDWKNNAGTNSITIQTQGSQQIEFSASDYVMSTNGDGVTLVSDGTDWFIP